MRAAVVALILITIAVMAAVTIHNEPPKSTLLVDASFKQPAFRLFTTCPVDQRNIPMLPNERTA